MKTGELRAPSYTSPFTFVSERATSGSKDRVSLTSFMVRIRFWEDYHDRRVV